MFKIGDSPMKVTVCVRLSFAESLSLFPTHVTVTLCGLVDTEAQPLSVTQVVEFG